MLFLTVKSNFIITVLKITIIIRALTVEKVIRFDFFQISIELLQVISKFEVSKFAKFFWKKKRQTLK